MAILRALVLFGLVAAVRGSGGGARGGACVDGVPGFNAAAQTITVAHGTDGGDGVLEGLGLAFSPPLMAGMFAPSTTYDVTITLNTAFGGFLVRTSHGAFATVATDPNVRLGPCMTSSSVTHSSAQQFASYSFAFDTTGIPAGTNVTMGYTALTGFGGTFYRRDAVWPVAMPPAPADTTTSSAPNTSPSTSGTTTPTTSGTTTPTTTPIPFVNPKMTTDQGDLTIHTSMGGDVTFRNADLNMSMSVYGGIVPQLRDLDSRAAALKAAQVLLQDNATAFGMKNGMQDSRLATLETNLATTMQTVNQNHETRLTTLTNNLAALDGRVQTAEGSITRLTQDLTAASTLIGTANTKIGTLETQVAGLMTNLGTATAAVNSATSTLTTVQGGLSTTNANVAALQTAVTDITKPGGALEQAAAGTEGTKWYNLALQSRDVTVWSFVDNNEILLDGVPVGIVLSKNVALQLPNLSPTLGAALWGTKGEIVVRDTSISTGQTGGESNQHREWSPEYLKGQRFGGFSPRDAPCRFIFRTLDKPATVRMQRLTAVRFNKVMPANSVDFVQGNFVGQGQVITATEDILVTTSCKILANGVGITDYHAIPPASNEIVGWRSNSAGVVSTQLTGSSAYTVRCNGQAASIRTAAHQSAQRDGFAGGALYSGPPCIAKTTNNAPINGYIWGDSTGGDSTTMLPTTLFRRFYRVTSVGQAKFLAVAMLGNGRVLRYNALTNALIDNTAVSYDAGTNLGRLRFTDRANLADGTFVFCTIKCTLVIDTDRDHELTLYGFDSV